MTMKRALASLRSALTELIHLVRELSVAVDDRPSTDDDPAIVDALHAHAAEVEGDAAETDATLASVADAEEGSDFGRGVRELAEAHERFHALGHRIRFMLASHTNLFELDRLARRRDAWRGWSEVILRQVERIDDAFDRADATFIACWQEIAERAAGAVSVSTTTIGQQIAVDRDGQRRHASAR